MSLIIKNVKKNFGSFKAVDDISFHVNEGEFIALLGPSGSGKTTLLRIIAGLEKADEGELYFEGKDVSCKLTTERQIGFVFQHFALFKHMNVFENIAFGLRLKKPRISSEVIEEKVNELLDLVHLQGMGQKYPSALSGGQRQRVALARVLAVQPKYMLLDEPFGALDSKVRKELRRWLKKLHDASGLTTIFVTHDQEEAMEISDRIAIINNGKLVQMDSPYELWKHPKNEFIYDFLGNYNVFFGTVKDNELLLFEKNNPSLQKFFSRPHETIVSKEPLDKSHFISGRLVQINKAGPYVKIELEGESEQIYQVELDINAFHALNTQLHEMLWIKPLFYTCFASVDG